MTAQDTTTNGIHTDDLRIFVLDPGQLKTLEKRVDQLNRRATRRGLTGQLAVEVASSTTIRTDHDGWPVDQVLFRVRITGATPRYAGWQFAARCDWLDSGLLLAAACDGPPVDRDQLPEQRCDHCRSRRHRTTTYVLVHDDGRQRQVGSTCLTDFLGHRVSIPVVEDLFKLGGDDDELFRMPREQAAWTPQTVVAAAWASVEQYGFRRADSDAPTRDHVMAVLLPRTRADHEAAAELAPYVTRAYDTADEILAWVADQRPDGDYMANLKVAATATYVTPQQVGLLASAPQAWARAQERSLHPRRLGEDTVAGWIGAPGDKVELAATIVSLKQIEGQWGTTWLYTLVTDGNYLVKWFASRPRLGRHTGVTRRMRGTVKAHETYRDTCQTLITRVKPLDPEPELHLPEFTAPPADQWHTLAGVAPDDGATTLSCEATLLPNDLELTITPGVQTSDGEFVPVAQPTTTGLVTKFDSYGRPMLRIALHQLATGAGAQQYRLREQDSRYRRREDKTWPESGPVANLTATR